MVTDTLAGMVGEAQALGITFNFVGDALQVTAPKTAEAGALLQRMAPHKDEIKLLLAELESDDQPTGDLLDWIGATVDAETWAWLQAECLRVFGRGSRFLAQQVADGWHVRRFEAVAGRAGWLV